MGTDISPIAAAAAPRQGKRLPPEVNRILYVRNLPFNITGDELYEVFGKYGAIRQIRIGDARNTKGTAFVVYEDLWDAKNALEHLSGFNIQNRYLIVLYHQEHKQARREDLERRERDLRDLQAKHGINRDEL